MEQLNWKRYSYYSNKKPPIINNKSEGNIKISITYQNRNLKSALTKQKPNALIRMNISPFRLNGNRKSNPTNQRIYNFTWLFYAIRDTRNQDLDLSIIISRHPNVSGTSSNYHTISKNNHNLSSTSDEGHWDTLKDGWINGQDHECNNWCLGSYHVYQFKSYISTLPYINCDQRPILCRILIYGLLIFQHIFSDKLVYYIYSTPYFNVFKTKSPTYTTDYILLTKLLNFYHILASHYMLNIISCYKKICSGVPGSLPGIDIVIDTENPHSLR